MMKWNNNVVRGTKKPLSERLAAKICEPYMDIVLQSCYSLRSLSYAMSYEDWCNKVHEEIKRKLGKE